MQSLLWEKWNETRAAHGAKVAVFPDGAGRAWTFGEIHEAVNRRRAVSRKILPCDAGNSIEFLVAFLTACRDRRVFLPLEPSLPARVKRELVCRFSQAALPEPTVMLKLTSGSSGLPKGIAVSDLNLVADARNIISTMGIRPDDTNLAAISVAHSYGFDNLILPLIVQGTPLVLLDKFFPRTALEAIVRHRVTVVPLVPFMFETLSALREDWSSVRLCISAGAMLSTDIARRFYETTGRKIHNFYGSSECGGICFDRTPEPLSPCGSVGTPLDGVSVTLNREGRVCVQGESVALGYADADATDARLGRGRFLTGDLGRFDLSGRLFLEGRAAATINVAGQKVHPAEIERCLMALHGVKAAAVVGLPGAPRGETVVALVVAEKLDEATVLRHCRARLLPWKVPRQLKIVSALPFNDRGKLLPEAVRALLGFQI